MSGELSRRNLFASIASLPFVGALKGLFSSALPYTKIVGYSTPKLTYSTVKTMHERIQAVKGNVYTTEELLKDSPWSGDELIDMVQNPGPPCIETDESYDDNPLATYVIDTTEV